MTSADTPIHTSDTGLSRRLPFVSVLIALAVGSVYLSQPLFFLLAERFDTTPEAMRDLFSISVTIYALSFFVAGPLTDLWPTTRLMAGGAAVLGLCLAAAALVQSTAGFTCAIIAAAASAAFVPAAGFALLGHSAPQHMQGVYFGTVALIG